MATTNRTKQCKRMANIFKICSILCFLVPFAVFAGIALAEGILVMEAVSLAATVLVTGIITLVCAINKTIMRSKIWIVLLVLFFILENFIPVILTIASTQIADELIFTPLYKHFRDLYNANKEIDRRI